MHTMPKLKAPSRDAQSKKKSAATKKHPKPAPPPGSFKSAEYVQESEEEEPENSEKAHESDSDDESLPSKAPDVLRTPNGKLQRPTGSSSSSENESESDENGSEADVEDEDEDESSDAAKETVSEPAKQVALHLPPNASAYTSRKTSKAPSATVVTFQEPAPYTPPVGFEQAPLGGTLKTAQMFKKSSLEGKQIWYFTAPASLSISLIEQMSLKDVTTGKAMINHQGNNYGFTPDSTGDKMYTKIMVPHTSGDGYRTSKIYLNVNDTMAKLTLPS